LGNLLNLLKSVDSINFALYWGKKWFCLFVTFSFCNWALYKYPIDHDFMLRLGQTFQPYKALLCFALLVNYLYLKEGILFVTLRSPKIWHLLLCLWYNCWKAPLWGGLQWVGFIMFQHIVEKLLNTEQNFHWKFI
jgi:hypothetical protein